MPTPRAGYYDSSGNRVPSVTGVLSRFKESGGITYWAWDMAYKPYRQARALLEWARRAMDADTCSKIDEFLAVPPERYDFRAARDRAAGVGTIVHARVDCWIRGCEFKPSEFASDEIQDPVAASDLGFGAFREWAGSTSFKLEEGEVQLVSNKWGFGGTPDVVVVNGDRTIGDWKTGNLYPEQVVPQLAAYRELLREHGRELSGGAHAISINKETGGFTHRLFTPEEVDRGWHAFRLMRELYSLMKEIK